MTEEKSERTTLVLALLGHVKISLGAILFNLFFSDNGIMVYLVY